MAQCLARDLLPTPTRLVLPTAQQRHDGLHVVAISVRIRRRGLEIGSVSRDLLLVPDSPSRFLALQRHHLHSGVTMKSHSALRGL